jgi:hypothetical protein
MARTRESVAFHEAAHAVVAVFYGWSPTSVTIRPDPCSTPPSAGGCEFGPAFHEPVRCEDDVRRRAIPIYAGAAAEAELGGLKQGEARDYATTDQSRVTDLANQLDLGYDTAAYEALRELAAKEVRSNWNAVARFAGELVTHETIEGAERIRTLATGGA